MSNDLFIYSIIYLFIKLFIHWIIYLFIKLFIYSIIYMSIYSFNYFIYVPIYLFPFISIFIYLSLYLLLFIYSFIVITFWLENHFVPMLHGCPTGSTIDQGLNPGHTTERAVFHHSHSSTKPTAASQRPKLQRMCRARWRIIHR